MSLFELISPGRAGETRFRSRVRSDKVCLFTASGLGFSLGFRVWV